MARTKIDVSLITPLTGPLDMSGNKLTSVGTPTNAGDAAIKSYVDALPFRIKQIVTATSTTQFSTTSGTYQTTNLSGSITPSSNTSKIFILAVGACRGATGTASIFSIFRDSSDLDTGSQGWLTTDASSDTVCTLTILDSPATTSAITYSIKTKCAGSAHSSLFGATSTKQYMLLVEVLQ